MKDSNCIMPLKVNRKQKLLIVFLFCVWGVIPAQAAIVDTIQVYSLSMQKNIKAVVVTPDSYASAKELPVVYLLHGYGGNYLDWINKAKGFEKAADLFNLIIVCPDGGGDSWYWDSPVNPTSKYETFVSGELIKSIDARYKTIKHRKGRAITGLSMGGQGALYLAFKHQDVFGACGSMSGGVDIRPFPNNWGMAKQLGTYAEHPERWEANTVMNLLYLLTPNSLKIIIDCGTKDFFSRVNETLHQQLLYRNIPHDYIARPGSHTWSYWTNAVKFHMLFMSNYFNSGEVH